MRMASITGRTLAAKASASARLAPAPWRSPRRGWPIPAGTSYTRPRVACRRARLLTLGSGETVEAMMQERPDPHESDMISGSSATLTSVTACQILGR